MNDQVQYCTFRLGGAEYALEVSDVQEVLRDGEWSVVPLAPASVLGLMNLRGQIVTVVDLATHLGLGPQARIRRMPLPAVNIVLSAARPPLSFAVDDVGDVVTLAANSLLAPPANLDQHARAFVRGVHLADQHLITVLETSALLEGFLDEGST